MSETDRAAKERLRAGFLSVGEHMIAAERDEARAENVRLDRMLVHAWAERDALKEALIRASQRLGNLGAHVPEPSRRTIAEVVADISQALAAVEEGKVS